MNKNIWLWWEQGWNQAPEICKMTVKSLYNVLFSSIK